MARERKKLPILMRGIIDNIVFSKDEVWAYYRIANSVYDFLSVESKLNLGSQMVNAFSNLVTDEKDKLECHLVVSQTPVDIAAWESQIREISKDWGHTPGFEQYLQKQIQHLQNEQYLKKVVYLGIKLGNRRTLDLNAEKIAEQGIQSAFKQIKGWVETSLSLDTGYVDALEENKFRRKETKIIETLQLSALKAEQCSAEELLLLLKRQLWPAMPAPYLEVDHGNRIGPGDIILENGSNVKNRLRWLELSQILNEEEETGYRATLTLTKLPKETNYPNESLPFLYLMHKLGLPFTTYARFTVIPSTEMKDKLEKKKKEQLDEQANASQAASNTDSQLGLAPVGMKEANEDMYELNEMLGESKTPWIEGRYHIVVETPTEAILKQYCTIVKDSFADIDVTVKWTVGDQKLLFLEQMPGDKVRVSENSHLTNLEMFATSGFNFSSDVGDLIKDFE